MQFGFERSSNVGNLNLGCMSDQVDTRGDFTSPFFPPLYGKGSTISGVASVFPTLHLQQSVRSDTSNGHFEAEQGRAV